MIRTLVWAGTPKCLMGTVYEPVFENGRWNVAKDFEGDQEEAFRIAKEIFDLGANVMITRRGDGFMIGIDDRQFQQR